jgi:hypothetical protein
VEFREDHTKSPFMKSYLYIEDGNGASEEDSAGEKLQVTGSVFYRHFQPSIDVMKELFGEKIFENPEDHTIIARLMRYCAGTSDLVLDSLLVQAPPHTLFTSQIHWTLVHDDSYCVNFQSHSIHLRRSRRQRRTSVILWVFHGQFPS